MTRQLILLTLLLLSTGPVYAEWVSIGTVASQGGATIYMDSDTIRRNGNLVKVWQLIDFKTVQAGIGMSFLSSKSRWQYDCTEANLQPLAMMEFTGHMGEGTVGFSNYDEGKWTPVSPGSIAHGSWEVACKKP